MTASRYTSYETSLALREAGADQCAAEKAWYVSPTGGAPVLCGAAVTVNGEIRAFRLDEILEALADTSGRDVVLLRLRHGTAVAEVFDTDAPITSSIEGYEDSPVEAAAACWLAVMRAGKAES